MEANTITIILNGATVTVLLGILIRSFSVGRMIGKYESSITTLIGEVTTLRTNVHKLSNEVARLSGREEVREQRRLRERNPEDSH